MKNSFALERKLEIHISFAFVKTLAFAITLRSQLVGKEISNDWDQRRWMKLHKKEIEMRKAFFDDILKGDLAEYEYVLTVHFYDDMNI